MKSSVALIQQFAYMPIFHNPNCLYADPIRYCLCEIHSCFITIHTWYNAIVHVLYIQPTVRVHVVTGIFSLVCTHL